METKEFKIGDKVRCRNSGNGVVVHVDDWVREKGTVVVSFENGIEIWYDKDGVRNGETKRTLYHIDNYLEDMFKNHNRFLENVEKLNSIKDVDTKHDPINPAHYHTPIQPLDFIEANKMNFLEGNIIKYVTRYKKKNGLEDLRKAQFYLNRLIENYGTSNNHD